MSDIFRTTRVPTTRPLRLGQTVVSTVVRTRIPSNRRNRSRNQISADALPPRQNAVEPPNSSVTDVFATISTLSGQLYILQQQRTAELAAKSRHISANTGATTDNCVICLDVLTSPESVVTQCGHVYHSDCLMKCPGFRHSSIPCPTCRRQICKPELITIRNGLPQKDPNFNSRVIAVDESPKPLVPCVHVEEGPNIVNEVPDATRNTRTKSNVTESYQEIMNLMSDSDDDTPLVSTTRERSSIGSDVVEVPCIAQDKSSDQTHPIARHCHCCDQGKTPTLDDELRRLFSLLRDKLYSGVEAYEKAKRDLESEFYEKFNLCEQKYMHRQNKLTIEAAHLDSREAKISADEIRIRKELEEAESLVMQHREAIAEINEEKRQLASCSKLVEQEKLQIDAIRAGLTDKEHELRVKESRVEKMMQLYNERLSALDVEAGDDVKNIAPEEVLPKTLPRSLKRKALNKPNDSLGEDGHEDSQAKCIADTTKRAARASKLRSFKRIASSSITTSAIDPTLVLGEELFDPPFTSRPVPSRLPRAKGTRPGIKKAPQAPLSSFMASRPGVQRPSGAVGKFSATRH